MALRSFLFIRQETCHDNPALCTCPQKQLLKHRSKLFLRAIKCSAHNPNHNCVAVTHLLHLLNLESHCISSVYSHCCTCFLFIPDPVRMPTPPLALNTIIKHVIGGASKIVVSGHVQVCWTSSNHYNGNIK